MEKNITFDELLKYVEVIRKENELIKDNMELINKVSDAMKNDMNIAQLVRQLQNTNNSLEIENLREKYEPKKETLSEEEQISKIYGIDLNNIEHIRLRSGKGFYKFYDNKTNKDIILRQNSKDKNLSQEFKDIQNQLNFAQGENALKNSEEIFNYQRMHTNNEVHMYPIKELEGNPGLLANISVEKLKALSTLIKNKEKLNLVSINPETGLALDDKHKIITAELDKNKEKYEVVYPQEYGYQNETENSKSTDSSEISQDTEQLDETSSIDNPLEYEEQLIDENRVRLYYEHPEMLDREKRLSAKEREKYIKAVEEYRQKVAIEKNNQPKVLVKKSPIFDRKGYADALILALFTGYLSGIISILVYIVIK